MVDLRAGLRAARSRPVEMLKAVVEKIREDDVPFMAGSIAYQAFVSLIPLLLLLFLVVAIVGDQSLAERVVRLTDGFLPDAAQMLVRDTIIGTDGKGSTSVSIIGLVTLVWGALKIFRGLDKAFSEIYESGEENTIFDQVKDGLVVLPVLGLSVVLIAGATSLFAVFEGMFFGLLNPLILVVGLTVAFLPMYYRFPDVDLSWREAVPGAAFAALGWAALQALFQVYVGLSGDADPSNVIGAIILLLTWLYFSGLVLLLGAVVNAVLLGETIRSPASDEDGARSPSEQVPELRERLAREHDRRRELESERDRLSRELEAESAWEPSPPAELRELRRHNRQLRRRLRWVEKPLYVRVALRLLGATPPDPPARTPEVWSTGAGQASDRGHDDGSPPTEAD